jgi:hypothetical protein
MSAMVVFVDLLALCGDIGIHNANIAKPAMLIRKFMSPSSECLLAFMNDPSEMSCGRPFVHGITPII